MCWACDELERVDAHLGIASGYGGKPPAVAIITPNLIIEKELVKGEEPTQNHSFKVLAARVVRHYRIHGSLPDAENTAEESP